MGEDDPATRTRVTIVVAVALFVIGPLPLVFTSSMDQDEHAILTLLLDLPRPQLRRCEVCERRKHRLLRQYLENGSGTPEQCKRCGVGPEPADVERPRVRRVYLICFEVKWLLSQMSRAAGQTLSMSLGACTLGYGRAAGRQIGNDIGSHTLAPSLPSTVIWNRDREADPGLVRCTM